MSEFLKVLPLAFVMIAGPQVISSVFLATSEGWARNTLAYLLGAALSISASVTIAYLITKGAKGGSSSKSSGGEGTTLDLILLALLAFLAIKTFLGRKTSEPPKWMGKLQSASPGFAFKLGAALLGVFPTDIATSATVGIRLSRQGAPLWHGLGFVALTLLLLAIPGLLVLVLGKRSKEVLPKVRDWMNNNSWIISEAVLALFIGIEINSLLSN
jgi:hypothetical protein